MTSPPAPIPAFITHAHTQLASRLTLAMLTASHALTWLSFSRVDGLEAPVGMVLGQNLWNATQALHLLLWIQLMALSARRWLLPTLLAWFFWLPWAHYLISQGGVIHSVLIALSCLWGLRHGARALSWSAEAEEPGGAAPRPLLTVRLELIALLCNLGSSLYNYNASRLCWPHWDRLYYQLGAALGFTPDPADVARAFYALGAEGGAAPSYLPLAIGNPVGAVVFNHLWGALPTLYILYFLVLYLNAHQTRGARLQRALCVFGVIHFLFLTDLVDYKFARGFKAHYGEWGHWTERLAWRIAILLPIYQKVTSGEWRAKGGVVGPLLHYGVSLWAVAFCVYQVLIYDVLRFYHFALGKEPSALLVWLKSCYSQELGYHGALVFMVLLYAALLATSRGGVRLVARAAW